MNNNEYKCDCCYQIFEKGWSDEEAEKEAKGLFPEEQPKDMALVCEDCFVKIMKYNKPKE